MGSKKKAARHQSPSPSASQDTDMSIEGKCFKFFFFLNYEFGFLSSEKDEFFGFVKFHDSLYGVGL